MLDPGRFDLSNEFNLLRIACGAFFVPHSIAKITEWEFSLDFFAKAGFPKPVVWQYLALAFEAALAAALILGLQLRIAGILGAAFLTIAAVACYRVSGRRWYWNFGGAEYCTFWALCCVIVAMHG